MTRPCPARFRFLFLVVVVAGVSVYGAAGQGKVEAPISLDPVQAEREARILVAELLAQKPDANSTNLGRLEVQPTRTTKWDVPVRFEIFQTASNWSSIYQTLPAEQGSNAFRLEVVHAPGKPNVYRLTEPGAGEKSRLLSGSQTMIPFAGSDFWVADLGYEFLFWPKQTLLKKEMRNNKFCAVLESANPTPDGQGYARVVSWITTEKPHGPAHADAYDSGGRKIKVFDPKTIEKVEGAYQIHSVEMRNLKNRSRTVMEFNSDQDL